MGTTIAAAAAAATLASALFIWFQVREMKKQTILQREIAAAAAAPYIWADVRVQTANGWNLEFAIGNSGPTVARNVVVTVDPPFPQTATREARYVQRMHERLERGLPSVAPGREYAWTLGNAADLVNLPSPLAHTVTIDCVGPAGPTATSQFTIDFESFRESVARHDGSLRDIAKEIKASTDRLVQEQKRQRSALEALTEQPGPRTFADVARRYAVRTDSVIGAVAVRWRRISHTRLARPAGEGASQQTFMHVIAPDKQLHRLQRRLVRRGFQVGPAHRLAGGIHVRVRTGTTDEQLVRDLVAKAAPDSKFGPPGAPTVHLSDYRAGC
ncbi:hypothetical protein [Nocardioides daejeonensis]|uniref:hypothetical protein n=1 Tax=Nocardioides daejeonensis TaxID=1046556 RepID=UPI0013A5539A|nr:hypothetical protein [Nocardioides daejeonensis]